MKNTTVQSHDKVSVMVVAFAVAFAAAVVCGSTAELNYIQFSIPMVHSFYLVIQNFVSTGKVLYQPNFCPTCKFSRTINATMSTTCTVETTLTLF